MALLGSLQVRLGLDTGTFAAGMTRFSRDVKGQTDGIAKSFGGLGGKIKTALGAAITTAAIAGFARMIQGANDLTDSLRDSSIRLGIAVGDLQAFQLAAGNAGIESGKLEGLIGKLNKASGEIKLGEGSEKTAAAFGAIGISLDQVRTSDPAGLFRDVIEGLGGIPDPATRSALAMQIFGKSGRDALTLVADGAESLRTSRQLLDGLGLSLSQINADNVDAANDALGTLSFVAGAAKQKFAAELSPAIADIANQLLSAGQQGTNFGQRLTSAAQITGAALKGLVNLGLLIGNAFSAGFNLVEAGAAKLGQGVTAGISMIIDAVGTKAPQAFNSLLEGAEKALTFLKQGFVDLATAIGNSFVASINAAIGAIETLVNTAADGINGVILAANAVAGTSFGLVPRANFGRASSFDRFPVDRVDLGRVDTFGQGARDDMSELSNSYGAYSSQQLGNAGSDIRGAIMAGDRLFSQEAEATAESLKEATGYANQLTGAINGTGSAGGDGGGGGGTKGAMKELAEESKKTAEELKASGLQVQNVWQNSMQSIGSAIDEFVKTGKLDFKSLVDSIIADLASAALKNAINSVFSGIVGAAGGNSGGWLNAIANGIQGIGSFEGGGYTGAGARSGGMDGRGGRLAMLHPNETVIDHDKVRRSATGNRRGRPVVNVSTPITLMPGVSREELVRLLPEVKRDIIATIPELIARGGRMASAFGQ